MSLAENQAMDTPVEHRTFDLLIDSVTCGDSLRSNGLDPTQVALLAESDGYWPPILVWGEHNEVVDGAHRVAAARRLRHPTVVAVRFVGTFEEARIEAVRRNTQHGLPLILEDRRRAARWILAQHPEWSDRRVAAVTGLSGKTIARVRIDAPSTVGDRDRKVIGINHRVGVDGVARPVRSEEARARIMRALEKCPEGSLRKIAVVAGTSPETVRRVRATLHSANGAVDGSIIVEPPERERPRSSVWETDPAFATCDNDGRFTQWFSRTSVDYDECRRHASAIPFGRIYEVVDEARRRANAWHAFATSLESRVRH